MVGAGFHSIAKLRAQILRTTTTILSPWPSAGTGPGVLNLTHEVHFWDKVLQCRGGGGDL
jgi:hypothetical protein